MLPGWRSAVGDSVSVAPDTRMNALSACEPRTSQASQTKLPMYWAARSLACYRAVNTARRLAGISAMSPRSAVFTASESGK